MKIQFFHNLVQQGERMNTLLIVLRLLHILGGVFWVGSSLMFGFFITPTVAATAEAGQKFLDHIVNKARVPVAITTAALLTVLAGGSMYWIDSGGLTSEWIGTGPGVGFGVGGILALTGLVFGLLIGKNVGTLAKMAAEVKGKPTPEQLTQIQKAQKGLGIAGPVSTIALVLALACMATARYWRF